MLATGLRMVRRTHNHRVWQLRANLTSYDAAYVALAETLGLALVTLDQRIQRAPGITCTVDTSPGSS